MKYLIEKYYARINIFKKKIIPPTWFFFKQNNLYFYIFVFSFAVKEQPLKK